MRGITGCLISLTAAALLMSIAALSQSQSLGDIARENREKKAAGGSSSTPPKVITNKNLPKDPDAGAGEDASATPSMPTSPSSPSPFNDKMAVQRPIPYQSTDHSSVQRQISEQRAAQQRANEQRAATQWKKRILQQQITVANLRMRVDQLRATMHFANVNTYNDMPFDRYQAQQMQRLRQVQHQLDEQRRKLENMQEAARHAGMHTLVYDP